MVDFEKNQPKSSPGMVVVPCMAPIPYLGMFFSRRCSVTFPTQQYRTGGRSRYRGDLPSKFELPSTAKKLPSKKGKPSAAENVPSCCVTAVKVPSKIDLPCTAKNLPSTLIPYKNYRQYCIPPERYRQHWIPPKRHRLFVLVFMFSSATHHILGSHIHILWLHVTCNTYVIYRCD